MDNREERKTLGKLTASEVSSVPASCRPCSLLGTPAAFSSSEVVRSATPSTWYEPSCSSSLSSVDYSQSPADLMDFYKSQIEVTILLLGKKYVMLHTVHVHVDQFVAEIVKRILYFYWSRSSRAIACKHDLFCFCPSSAKFVAVLEFY